MKVTTKKTSVSTLRTRKLLMTSLLTLMEKKDFESIATTEICQHAMVPRATFYNHFEDKYDLLRYCIHYFQDKIIPIPERDEDFTSMEYYNRLLQSVVGYAKEHLSAFRKIGKANNNGIVFVELQKYISRGICEHLNNMQRVAVSFGVPTEVVAEFYSSAIVFLVKWWIEGNNNYTEAQIADYVSRLITNEGVLLPKAQKQI